MSLRSGSIELEGSSQFGTSPGRYFVDARRHPRFRLEIDIRIYPRNTAVVRGHTVNISESGISAMLREEVKLDEVVRLEFTLPHGEVEVHALVRHRSAFRYGFQFLESAEAQDVIGRTCREFAMAQTETPPKT